MQFTPITLEQQTAYRERFALCAQKASDYSFINLWAWSQVYGLEWAWNEDLIWIRQQKPEPAWWAPVGQWKTIDWVECFKQLVPTGAIFERVPEELVRLWRKCLGGGLKAEEKPGDWDYLYDRNALVELRGNRYHKKKNLLKQFVKSYDYEMRSFNSDLVEQALDMQESWCTWRDCESSELLSAENTAIANVLENWSRLQAVNGAALFVEDDMVAYTIGEPLSENTLLIHFEKGQTGTKGVYQAINQMFLATQPDFAFVNREQDLNDDGLRKAKRSYHPVDFVKKYRCIYS